MTKQEFLEKLRLALTGNVPGSVVSENLQYYEDYINTRIRLGEPEENVLKELGDARLIARSIVAAENEKTGAEEKIYNSSEEDARRGVRFRHFFHMSSLPPWALPVIAGGSLLLLLVVLGLVFRLVLHMLAWLWPVIAIAMILLFFIKLFRDWLH